jgi:hypothetical protein
MRKNMKTAKIAITNKSLGDLLNTIFSRIKNNNLSVGADESTTTRVVEG